MAPFMGMIIATFGAFTFYQVGNQAMIQRMLAARSTWDALVGLIFAQFINFLRPLVTCFLGSGRLRVGRRDAQRPRTGEA